MRCKTQIAKSIAISLMSFILSKKTITEAIGVIAKEALLITLERRDDTTFINLKEKRKKKEKKEKEKEKRERDDNKN